LKLDGANMKPVLCGFAGLLLLGAVYLPPAKAEMQVWPRPGLSVQPPRGAPWFTEPLRQEWPERERFYGSGLEEAQEEKFQEQIKARESCDRILNSIERDRCYFSLK
jgi:hypothetical protein